MSKSKAKFDEKLLQKASDMSEKELAEFVKAAKSARKKKKDEQKKSFSKAAGKIVLKHLKEIESGTMSEEFKNAILSTRDKFLKK